LVQINALTRTEAYKAMGKKEPLTEQDGSSSDIKRLAFKK